MGTETQFHVGFDNLESVIVGSHALADSRSLSLKNLTRLQSLSIGNGCFHKATTLVLEGCNGEEWRRRSPEVRDDHGGRGSGGEGFVGLRSVYAIAVG